MATTSEVSQTQNALVKPEVQVSPQTQDKYSKWEINWDRSNSYWTKESQAQSAVGYYAQMTAYKVAAVAVGILESIQNLFLWIGNQFISLANVVNRHFAKTEEQAEEAKPAQVEPVVAQIVQEQQEEVVVVQVAKTEEQEEIQEEREVLATVDPEPNMVRQGFTFIPRLVQSAWNRAFGSKVEDSSPAQELVQQPVVEEQSEEAQVV